MSNDRLTTYQEAITKEFAFLKAATCLEDTFAKGINLPTSGGLLLPVSKLHQDDAALIGEMIEWNRLGALCASARTAISVEEMKTWFHEEALEAPGNIVFLVLNKHGQRAGRMGFSNCINPDLVMKLDYLAGGSASAELLSEAAQALIRWAQTTLWPENICVKVAATNSSALEFFRKLGFEAGQFKPESGVRELILQPATDGVGKSMILTAGPSISAREASYAFKAAKYGWNNQWSFYLKAFEKGFSEYIGVTHAMATSSCTGALHIALAALGLGPGDEVIVPDTTWVATANAVLYVGATPMFADVESESWCLDPTSFESKITPRTKAVIPVHLYGHPCNMDAIMAIAKKHNLYVVEDAAPSIGAECRGRRTGSFGHFACFSFQGAKLTVTGEGGMLLTSDPKLYETAYSIWDQGRQPGTFWIQSNGLKYKMANALAAIGLGQLERNDAMVEAKRRVFRWYEEGLAGVPHITLNREMPWARSIYWMSSILLDEKSPLTRDQLRQKLKQCKVDTRDVFPAISQYPIWPVKQPPQPVAWRIGQRAINLPSGVCLAREEVDYVCRCIRTLLKA